MFTLRKRAAVAVSLLALAVAICWAAGGTAADASKATEKGGRQTGSSTDKAVLSSGVDLKNFDKSIKPGDDFYEYVNGNWIKDNPIPPEYSRWGAFPKLRDDALTALHSIIEDVSKNPTAADPNQQKLRDLFATAMDEAKLEAQGVKPLAGDVEKIGQVKDTDGLVALVGYFHARGVSSMFGFGVHQDEKQSTRYAPHLSQGGLGLPEREYYLGQTDDFKKIRDAYHQHVEKMLVLLGQSAEQAKLGADAVLKIETQLADASRSPVKLRDREAQYNPKSTAELAALTPNLKWNVYFKAIEAPAMTTLIIGQPEFFERLNTILKDTPIADWQAYLRWHLIHSTASCLNDAVEGESFHFYSEVLRGIKEKQPRWKRAVHAADHYLGEALGRLYVEKYFKPAAKTRMEQLVKNLLLAYRERLETREWMSPETRKQALAKLAAVTPKIGYPDEWRDYSKLEIKTDSYVQNVLRAEEFEWQHDLHKLGGPVDRKEWHMTPPTVNAYYSPSMNEIVFPAAILQPPFFDPNADDAVNYGGIGSVIGHEITHGFDDQGSRSNGEGNLVNWWTADDRERFNAKTAKLVEQYDACVAVDDLHVNGKLTLGENIADLGGVVISHAAYIKSLGGKPAPVLDGFTGSQRFFIGYAQVWRGAARDKDQRVLLRTDPHSPFRFRTLVPLSNLQEFYDAFDIKSGAQFRGKDERVVIW